MCEAPVATDDNAIVCRDAQDEEIAEAAWFAFGRTTHCSCAVNSGERKPFRHCRSCNLHRVHAEERQEIDVDSVGAPFASMTDDARMEAR